MGGGLAASAIAFGAARALTGITPPALAGGALARSGQGR